MHWLLSDLKKLGGYYICPESPEGKLLGPLVGYAGRYEDAEGIPRQFVGKVYFNYAKGEQNPKFRQTCAYQLKQLLMGTILHLDCIIGMPMGGILLATELGSQFNCDTIFPEKKITALATETQREQSKLVLDRHDLRPGSYVILLEDVCNNFSTTAQAVELVLGADCKIAAIACAINRSTETEYSSSGLTIPVISLFHQPTQQFRQDDPAVAEHIAANNVAWKPKSRTEWPRLKAAMEQFQVA
jgi:orotate phosphoribosyltransferase